jgi:preprotein translocase subunit SecD
MAKRTNRPGRTLIIFFTVLAVAYGLVALAGQWKPYLGLDLQGGTRITLIAKGNPSAANLKEAQRIINKRVNGSGVSEAEVTTQGNRFVVVEIPGQSRRDLVETVKRQAQLRFRLVAQTGLGTAQASSSASPGNGLPSGPVVTVSPTPTASASTSPKTTPKKSKKKAGSRNRAPFLPQGKTTSPSPSASPSAQASASPSASPTAQPSTAAAPVDDPLKWMDNPGQEWLAKFQAYTCPKAGTAKIDDVADQPLITCDENGVKYLLSAAALEGGDLSRVGLLTPNQQSVEYGVDLNFNGTGTKEFAKISDALYGTQKQFAIVLDGQVISAPTMNGIIHDGRAQITGNFSETEAQSLTTSLKFGALPIQFQSDPPVETVGPSLAGEQLSAGVLAGILGLLLVMIYCLLYYRGLGLVVIASLVIAGAATYALVMLLSKTAGFTLTLPGIAGLIVAVGITADSFIVYFERIRDEMRDGKSARLAVEAGWRRARNTCLAADTVSLLAAVVLYIFAAGVVKGFAFALGLSTLIDLAVFFWFTHPMMTFLAAHRFFSGGHKLSGLSAETLGVDRINLGGRA